MDPTTMILIVILAGGVVAVGALRRAGTDGSRAFRASDPASLLVGAAVIGLALLGAWLLLRG